MHNSLLVVGIGIATLLILMLAVLACLLDRRLSVETARVEALRQGEERFRSLVQNTYIITVVAADDPIDAKTLQSLRQMAGARATEVIEQLLDNYLAEAPQLLQAMRVAVATKDVVALLQAAQTLRSASANVGATSVCQLCKVVEAMGSAGTTAGALARVLQVEAAYATVKAALQMERQRV